MSGEPIPNGDQSLWTVFVDRRGGCIHVLRHDSSDGFDLAELRHESADGTVRVWRDKYDALIADEASIAPHTAHPPDQLKEFRLAVERLVEIAGVERSWLEPADLIRMIDFEDDGAQSFLTYGRGRPRSTSERESENEAAFMGALAQARANEERLRQAETHGVPDK